jgi:hypothetical protein
MIIGIAGRKQAGKTFAAKHIQSKMQGAVLVNFSDALKEIVLRCFVPSEWGLTVDALVYDENKSAVTPCGLTIRELLQKVGTEWFRSVCPDVWIRTYYHKISNLLEDSNVVITPDVRFPNEVRFIQQQGGVVIFLTRAPFPEDRHESEVALEPAAIGTTQGWKLNEIGKKSIIPGLEDMYNKWKEDPVIFDYIFDNGGTTKEEHRTLINNWLDNDFRRVRVEREMEW